MLQDNISIHNNKPPNRLAKIVKETPLQIKSHTDPQAFIVGDFNISLSPIDRSSIQNFNRKQLKLTENVSQMDLT